MATATRAIRTSDSSPDHRSGNQFDDESRAFLSDAGVPSRWTVFSAHAKYWAWKLFCIAVIGVIYVAVVSAGLRYLLPDLGQRLYKVPGLSWMYHYENTHRLDLAHGLAVFLFIGVWVLWNRVLRLYLQPNLVLSQCRFNPEAYQRLVVTLGVVILGADACLFYCAMTQVGWRGTSFSVPALLATAAYVALLVFCSFVSCTLQQHIDDLKCKQEE